MYHLVQCKYLHLCDAKQLITMSYVDKRDMWQMIDMYASCVGVGRVVARCGGGGGMRCADEENLNWHLKRHQRAFGWEEESYGVTLDNERNLEETMKRRGSCNQSYVGAQYEGHYQWLPLSMSNTPSCDGVTCTVVACHICCLIFGL